ncbi:hypothetical protein AGABI2DRAFT_115313 [Agaricus bisporus var. bisporus H97]|uniref:hypothetical protein n=1 Tax=Agaricus bisporus var. bisporus (strain H97 / ATCC MYA-4626 / FGSC 10389) TaxID=936046 RepID=UPI00029F4F3E|nr:hypothetical protein AGABI2DRAFT_115313 [Agaricus bisporus var. bisporus H97]EKV50255.1 hypothetical protein AGABI2DRAFT_115313 [Agaricus bisporus var. bisporus H97]
MPNISSSNGDSERRDEDSEHLLSQHPEPAEFVELEMGLEVKVEERHGDNWARSITLTGVAILVLTTWFIVIFNGPSKLGWFAFHPLLQTLALGSFTYGILTLQPTSQPVTKAAGFLRHQTAMFFVGFPLIMLGTSSVVYNKYLRGTDHAKTWHGTLGFTCVSWLLLQIFLGAGSVWKGGALFGGGAKAKALWKYHRASGYVLFPLMMLTAHLGGGWSHWGEKYAGSLVRLIAYTVAPVLIFTGLYVRIRVSKMKFW